VPARAVLFDLDNTLIFEDEATFLAVRAVAESAGEHGVDAGALASAAPRIAAARWTESSVYEWADRFGIWWGEGLWADFDDGAPNELRVLHEFAPTFRRRVWREALAAVGGDPALAGELADAFRILRRKRQLVDPDADAMLADLSRDHALAIVTNGAPSVQREKLAGTTLARHFGAIVISVEVGVPKPDPRIFELALERLGVPAENATMVGDSRPRDVGGARAVGMRTILRKYPDDKWSEGPGPEPDARIDRLSELRALLR
jgi:phosphoserine phosphatase